MNIDAHHNKGKIIQQDSRTFLFARNILLVTLLIELALIGFLTCFRYIQESLGLHELAPQYRQFFHIFEAFKIADAKPSIAPPQLAIPTALSTKASMAMGDQFQEEMEEGEEVSNFP